MVLLSSACDHCFCFHQLVMIASGSSAGVCWVCFLLLVIIASGSSACDDCFCLCQLVTSTSDLFSL